MTREEAIKSALKFLVRKQQEQCSWGYADNDDTHEVSWDEIIRWVDQRSCGDLISRQAAIEAMEQTYCDIERVKKRPITRGEQAIFLDMRGVVRSLPSVEPEKCGNCTIKQAIIDTIETDCSWAMFDEWGNYTPVGECIIEAINRVPSVEPEQSQCSWYGEDGRCHFAEQEMDECEDCISRQAALSLKTVAPIAPVMNGEAVHYEEVVFVRDLEKLTPVEPERKTGKWINVDGSTNTADCNCCGNRGRTWMNYCYECGADMREVQNDKNRI